MGLHVHVFWAGRNTSQLVWNTLAHPATPGQHLRALVAEDLQEMAQDVHAVSK